MILVQDRFAGLTGPGSYRGGLRGAPRGGGRGGRGFRGRGGFGGGGEGRSFDQNLYADYPGPDQQSSSGGGTREGYQSSSGGYGAGYDAPPSKQIMAGNVSAVHLPEVSILTFI